MRLPRSRRRTPFLALLCVALPLWSASPPEVDLAIRSFADAVASGQADRLQPILPGGEDWPRALRTADSDPQASGAWVGVLDFNPTELRVSQDSSTGDWLARQADGLQLELRYRGEPPRLVGLHSRALGHNLAEAMLTLDAPHARYLFDLRSAARLDAPLCELSGRRRNRLALLGAMRWPFDTPLILRQLRAEQLLAFGRFEQALGNDLSAETPEPPPPGLLRLRGEALLRAGRAAEALEAANAVLAQVDDDALAWVLRGAAQTVLGEREAAAEAFRTALALLPAASREAKLVHARLARIQPDALGEAAVRWRELPEGEDAGDLALDRLLLAGDDQGFDAALAVHLAAWPQSAPRLAQRWGVAPALLTDAARDGLSVAHWKEVARLPACRDQAAAASGSGPHTDRGASIGTTAATASGRAWWAVLAMGALLGASIGLAFAALIVDRTPAFRRGLLYGMTGIGAVLGAVAAVLWVEGW